MSYVAESGIPLLPHRDCSPWAPVGKIHLGIQRTQILTVTQHWDWECEASAAYFFAFLRQGRHSHVGGWRRWRVREISTQKCWMWWPKDKAVLEARVEHVNQDASSASCEEDQHDIRWLFPQLWWKTWPTLLHRGGAYFTKCSVPEYSSPRLGGHVSTSGHLASTVGEQRSKVVLSSVSLCTWSRIKTHGTGPSQWRWVLPPQLIKPRNVLTDMFSLVSEVLIDPVELTMITIAVAFGL